MTDLQAARMSEADLDRAVRRILRTLPGLLAYHTRTSVGSHAGFPDWVICGPGGVMWRELKTGAGKLTAAQRQWQAALTAAGADVAVWRPQDLLSGRAARELAALAGLTSFAIPERTAQA